MTTEEQELRRRQILEEREIAMFAAGVANSMKQTNSMTVGRSKVSNAEVIDPRKFLKTVPTGVERQQVLPPAPVPANNLNQTGTADEALAPKYNLIPLPKGISADEVIPPEMRKRAPNAPALPQAPEVWPNAPVVPPATTDNQLELTFDRQATLNDIYNHLDLLDTKIDKVLKCINKLVPSYENVTTTNTTGVCAPASPASTDTSGKKKS